MDIIWQQLCYWEMIANTLIHREFTLLGKDDLIMDICPAYETDAFVRRVNVDRYDDREIIRTNLIESYGLLMELLHLIIWNQIQRILLLLHFLEI